jgi:hypothetical protein
VQAGFELTGCHAPRLAANDCPRFQRGGFGGNSRPWQCLFENPEGYVRSDLACVPLFPMRRSKTRKVSSALRRKLYHWTITDCSKPVCKVTKASRGRRHEYAHHLWGIPNIPDALALLDPRDSLKQMVSFEEQVDEYRERMSQWTSRTSGMNLHQRGHTYPMHAPVATFGGARLFERQVFHEGGPGG